MFAATARVVDVLSSWLKAIASSMSEFRAFADSRRVVERGVDEARIVYRTGPSGQ